MKQLQIESNSTLVGNLDYDQANDRLNLIYDENWKRTGFPLSFHLPFDDGFNGGTVKKFVENLFPEGSNFEDLLGQYHL